MGTLRAIVAEERAQGEGMFDTTPNDYTVQSAALQIANRQAKIVQSFLADFGMTPASRSRVSTQPPDDPDP